MFEQKKHSSKKGGKVQEKENELKKQFEEAKPTEAAEKKPTAKEAA